MRRHHYVKHTSKMAYSSTTIEILLIKDKSVNSGDDKITITKNLQYNEFQVKYTEVAASRTTPLVYKSSGMYREKMVDYIHLLLKSQYADDEPYGHVQINVPCMPCVILSTKKLNEAYFREYLEDLVLMGLDMLETTEIVKKKTKQVLPTPSYRETPDYQNHNYYPDDSYAVPSRRSSLPGTVPQHLFWDE